MAKKRYSLRENVRVYSHSDDEVRFRKGVWNYVEAVINLRGQTPSVRKFFSLAVDHFVKEETIDVDEAGATAQLSEEENGTISEIFADVTRQGFLHEAEESKIRRALAGILGGGFSGLEQFGTNATPVLFVSDNAVAKEIAATTARQIGLPLHILDAEILDQLTVADLTTKTDAIDHMKTYEKFQKYFSEFSCVAGVFLTPNVSLLRNMNRILVNQEKAFVLGLVDGPFASVVATVAQQGGCFECYENRLLARLEDMTVYQRFVASTHEHVRHNPKGSAFVPLTNILTSAVLMEAVLYSSLKLFKLAGRMLNIYMPMLEIQVQDLLRVPYCPACGHIAKNQMSEIYISSQKIMDRLIERVEIQRSEPVQRSDQ